MKRMLWKYEAECGRTGELLAYDAQEAAEYAWSELCMRDPDFYKGGEIEVWEIGGPKSKFTVEVQSVPEFHATPMKEKV